LYPGGGGDASLLEARIASAKKDDKGWDWIGGGGSSEFAASELEDYGKVLPGGLLERAPPPVSATIAAETAKSGPRGEVDGSVASEWIERFRKDVARLTGLSAEA